MARIYMIFMFVLMQSMRAAKAINVAVEHNGNGEQTTGISDDERVVSSVSDDPNRFNYIEACRLIASQKVDEQEYFDNFRRIPAYLEIVEPTDAWIAKAYMEYIVQNCSWVQTNATIFDKVTQIDAFGNPHMHTFVIGDGKPFQATALAMRFGAFVGKISNKILNRAHYSGNEKISTVLEIGGGFGALALVATDILNFDSYTIVDIPEALNVQKKFMSQFPSIASKIKYIDGKKLVSEILHDRNNDNLKTEEVDKNVDVNFDLCISTFAFSELTLQFREIYFEKFVKFCKAGFFIVRNFMNTHVCQYTSINSLLCTRN